MDSASLQSLTPILDNIDQWSEIASVLPVLIILEIILSADNAVALASITKNLNNISLQRIALNIGISISLLLRIALLLAANIIIKYPLFKLLASIYLFILAFRYFFDKISNSHDHQEEESSDKYSLFKIILLLSFTDFAFSIDSVTAAVAISDQLILVVTGTLVGVLALRFTSDLFLRWLEIFINLESAGYLAVALVGLKLTIQVFLPSLELPDIVFYIILILLFSWGFLRKKSFS